MPTLSVCHRYGKVEISLSVIAAIVILCGIAVYMLIPTAYVTFEPSRQSQCRANVSVIAKAMYIYHEQYRCFPPAFTVDEKGRRLHSWRVLLLPALDLEALYRAIRLDEPWDSPHNAALAKMMPSIYQCPAAAPATSTETPYQVVVGARTMFPGKEGRRKAEASDGESKTIMLVETRARVPWMKPQDLEFEKMGFKINDPNGPAIGSCHTGGAMVAFVDGHVEEASDSADPELVRQMLIINDGEPQKACTLEAR